MRVIGITGGIGSGKTTVTALYHSLGVPAVDADAIGKSLTAPGGEALPRLREAFGNAVFTADGTLDRAALAKMVFGRDDAALRRLNAIMHPRIIRCTQEALATLREAGEPIALLDAPLLFETGMDTLCDAILCVTAPVTVRIRRIQGRDHLTYAQALARIRNQNPAQRTQTLSDYVLSTDAPIDITRARALTLWQQILTDGPKRVPR